MSTRARRASTRPESTAAAASSSSSSATPAKSKSNAAASARKRRRPNDETEEDTAPAAAVVSDAADTDMSDAINGGDSTTEEEEHTSAMRQTTTTTSSKSQRRGEAQTSAGLATPVRPISASVAHQVSPSFHLLDGDGHSSSQPLLRVKRLEEKAELQELNKRLELYILRQRERDASQGGLNSEIMVRQYNERTNEYRRAQIAVR